MTASLVAVYERACSDASVPPNSALTQCFAAVNSSTPLQALSLHANLVGPRGLTALLPVLRVCRQTLQSVDLSFNNLDNAAVLQLVRYFANGGFVALRRLELRGNPLTYQGGKCLVHWCEGLEPVRHARRARGFNASKRASVTDAASSSHLSPSGYWCDADDVHITYIGLEETVMPEALRRSLQQRIADAVARRETRRLQRGAPQLPRPPSTTGRRSTNGDTSRHDAATTVVADGVSSGAPTAAEVTVSAMPPRLEGLALDDSIGSGSGSADAAVLDDSDGVPLFLRGDADGGSDVHKPTYDDASVEDDDDAAGAAEPEVVEADSGEQHRRRSKSSSSKSSSSSSVRDVEQEPHAAKRDAETALAAPQTRSGSAADTVPFLSNSLRDGSDVSAPPATSHMYPPASSSTSSSSSASPLSAVRAAALPVPAPPQQQQQQQQQRVPELTVSATAVYAAPPPPPPPPKTAASILDELGLDAVAAPMGGGDAQDDPDAAPAWLEEI
ncbi:hypothetical protein NESM_000413700 [Novymonas esmeraldas]|uniref:Uncharacterized protein n=1 Tax=Novymonas esmeraldas TaxID=1808958 RepID=A0AAW0EN75_9TRYP